MAEVTHKSSELPDEIAPGFQNLGLFSDHFLKARLPQWKEWQADAEIRAFRKELLLLYESVKSALPHMNEAQTEEEFVQPVLNLLGYADSYAVQAPTKVGQQTLRPDYALFPDVKAKNQAYEKFGKNDYSQCIGIADAKYWERELDRAKSSDRDTFSNQNPSFQIAGYLTGTKQTWGILTNGRLWRLYSSRSHMPLGNYYQVDLLQLLERTDEDLNYFYLFFCKAALVQADGKSFLDRVFEGSEEYAVELESDVKERAYDVVERLCRGFAAEFAPDQLAEPILKDIYDNSLTLLYRLLFIFYAEARDLLPLTSSTSYRDNYSLRKMALDIDEVLKKGEQLSSHSKNYYHRLSDLFRLVDRGDRSLGVPEYNGGLFDGAGHAFLEQHGIADSFLVDAIRQLARIPDNKLGREVAVDYNTLSERHLGSIYEGLLEFKPKIAPSDLVAVKDKSSIRYAPASEYPGKRLAYSQGDLYLANDKGERKASGSYYTPEYIVNYIVENTLDPLVKEAAEKTKALQPEVNKKADRWRKLKTQKQGLEPMDKYDVEIAKELGRLLEPYLSLKVLDPAMGSGHFLSRATDFLAEAIATDPSVQSLPDFSEESELTYYRRRVVESCIYGVDLNPLAVELAKLTLWLTTMAKSKPLSFLNHHLRVGNSLIGARVSELDEIPKAKRKRGQPLDLSRAPVQLGLFQEALNKKLYDLLQNRALIAQLPTETLEDVRHKEKWERDFERSIERFRTLADIWVSTYFGNTVAWDEYNVLVENLNSPGPAWDKLVQRKYVRNALEAKERYRFFHWEMEFPEVFYDGKGERKANAGFDAVVGNPPYEVLSVKETRDPEVQRLIEFFAQVSQVAKGKQNMYRLMVERSYSLLPVGAFFGFIIPATILADQTAARLRELFIQNSAKASFYVFPESARVFEEITQAVCVMITQRGNALSGVSLATDLMGADHLQRAEPFSIPIDALKLIDPNNLSIPAVPETGWTVLQRIHRWPALVPVKGAALADIFQGEVNLTVFASCLRTADTGTLLVRGDHLQRYAVTLDRIAGEEGWLAKSKYIAAAGGSTKAQHHLQERLAFQEVANMQLERRLNCSCIPRNVFLGHTANYLCNFNADRHYLLALLNSTLLNWRFKATSTNNHVSGDEVRALPIRRINFATPEAERERLVEEGERLYQEYLQSKDWCKVLSFIAQGLPQKSNGSPDAEQEKSDVVHDLLAFLAEEMTRLNKEKQSRIKGFLTWLEKEILKGSVEDQKNKTRIKDFHNNTFEDLLDVLKKNKVVPDPCPSKVRDTIASEFSAAANALTPLKARLKATDGLIDQIVYRLYGLTEEEIAIVEGSV